MNTRVNIYTASRNHFGKSHIQTCFRIRTDNTICTQTVSTLESANGRMCFCVRRSKSAA